MPAALSGIITGIVLAMARVAGETAPLLMTAFGTTFWNTDISQPMDALTAARLQFHLEPVPGANQPGLCGGVSLNSAHSHHLVCCALGHRWIQAQVLMMSHGV